MYITLNQILLFVAPYEDDLLLVLFLRLATRSSREPKPKIA